MKPALVMLGGWAHPAAALHALADATAGFAAPRLVAAHEPLPEMDAPAFLLGWSLGGLRALSAVAEQPGRWRGVILVSSCARFCSAPDYAPGVDPARLRAMKAALRKNPAAILGWFFSEVAAPHTVLPATLAENIRAAEALGLEPLAAGLEFLLTCDVRSRLSGCDRPALVVHGREDRVIPWPAGVWLAERLPRARFVPLAGVGHDLPLRAWYPLAMEIKSFLEAG